MNRKKLVKIIYLIIALCLVSCSKKKYSRIYLPANLLEKKKPLNRKQLKNWSGKDLLLDTVPGISLYRLYDSLLVDKEGKEVIVAILDTEIDTNHKDLKGKFWINEDEIPDNNIDDDYNGYVDDVKGWNFLGNLKGGNIIYANLECVRILREYGEIFKNSDSTNLKYKYPKKHRLYIEAKRQFQKELVKAQKKQRYGDFLYEGYPIAVKKVDSIYPKGGYTTKDLDSIYKKYKKENKNLARYIYFMSDFIKYNLSEEWIKNYKEEADFMVSKILNLEFNERLMVDKKPNDINYTNYGNPCISKNIDKYYHGTEIAGVIAGESKDSLGVNGIVKKIKIMPLSIAPLGNVHDKDIALAIRYAVDNGANIINMSFGKDMSMYKEWVFEAMKYAAEKNVLIVSSAGNTKLNLNITNNYYPNDNVNNEKEVIDNFLLVGSISHKLDKSLLSYFSNYGNIDVDLFAPGEDIYTTMPNNKYKVDRGTSLSAAITSGVAALIYSYYPNLTASQVKHILMDSGLEYTFEVSTPTKEDKNKTTPFNQLSKSGKVLNAYNALIMADSISRN